MLAPWTPSSGSLASAPGGARSSVHDFLLGVKRTALEPGELVVSVTVPVLDGWQGFAKVGVRNAMVIAVTVACLVVDRDGRSVRLALGAVGPTVLRAREAEAWVTAEIDWDGWRLADPGVAAGVPGPAWPAEARPIDDHRSTADYRRHAVGVPGPPPPPPGVPAMTEQYVLRVNGADAEVRDAWVGESLLYVLRERLGLPGAKGACEQGECGSCSVLVDGVLVCSCLVLAASAIGRDITTVEGLTASAGDTA